MCHEERGDDSHSQFPTGDCTVEDRKQRTIWRLFSWNKLCFPYRGEDTTSIWGGSLESGTRPPLYQDLLILAEYKRKREEKSFPFSPWPGCFPIFPAFLADRTNPHLWATKPSCFCLLSSPSQVANFLAVGTMSAIFLLLIHSSVKSSAVCLPSIWRVDACIKVKHKLYTFKSSPNFVNIILEKGDYMYVLIKTQIWTTFENDFTCTWKKCNI